MRNNISIFFLLVLSVFFAGCKNHEHEHDMGATNSDAVDPSLAVVVRPTNEVVISSQATVKPQLSTSGFDITANGFIVPDQRRNNKVAARFDGRIEKLYVKYNYQYVAKGQAIMELYSPELVTIEEEYLYLIKNNADTSLIRKTKIKLLLLGITQNQINKLVADKETTQTITIFSGYDGYVLLDDQQQSMNNNSSAEIKNVQNSGMNGMSQGQNSSSMSVSGGKIAEGSYVSKGQTLFMVNDFKNVWAILSVKENNKVGINNPVQLFSDQLGNASVNSSISFIEPVYENGQKFTSCRVNLDNSDHRFSINSIVNAKISTSEKTSMQIPLSSVLFLGQRKIVWVKTGTTPGGHNIFEKRDIVSSGFQSGEYIEIISGITVNDEIAKDAGFLIDSQSLIEPR